MKQEFVGSFPCIADAGRFSVGYGYCVDGVGVLMIKYKNIVIAAAGGNRESACLVRV